MAAYPTDIPQECFSEWGAQGSLKGGPVGELLGRSERVLLLA